MIYCYIDTTARQYSRFDLLFAGNGNWGGEQIISKDYIDQTFTKVWQGIKSDSIAQDRGYALHWWISRHDDRSIIFNASGKFGQYIFMDRTSDIVFTLIIKYHPPEGSRQGWGALNYVNGIGSIDFRLTVAEFLESLELIEIGAQIKNPVTLDEGTSKEFFDNYSVIIDALVDISRPE
ncbi:MAG: serine hydrolase [Porticoccaceae bacterium]